jgi:hypothetical protein
MAILHSDEAHFQYQFIINVSVGKSGDLLTGTYSLPLQLSGASYLDFFNGRITSTTGGCTIGNVTNYVIYT